MAGFSFKLVADDYAISPAVSRGIREALGAGRLSGTGAMTNRPAWRADARALAADGLAERAGLHLNLTCGQPLSRMAEFTARGGFPSLGAIIAGARMGRLPRQEIMTEIAAQLDAFADALGRAPAFVDGHQHVHALPLVREALFEALAARGWVEGLWVRDSADRPSAILRRGVELKKAFTVAALTRGGAIAARAAGLSTNEGFSGFSAFDPARDYGDDFARYLRAPGRDHLVMCHPGYVDDPLRAVDPNTESRVQELRFLLSPRFSAMLSDRGASLKSI